MLRYLWKSASSDLFIKITQKLTRKCWGLSRMSITALFHWEIKWILAWLFEFSDFNLPLSGVWFIRISSLHAIGHSPQMWSAFCLVEVLVLILRHSLPIWFCYELLPGQLCIFGTKVSAILLRHEKREIFRTRGCHERNLHVQRWQKTGAFPLASYSGEKLCFFKQDNWYSLWYWLQHQTSLLW